LEWRRLKELGQDYAELQPPNADHPLGYDAWKDFQRVWGQAEDAYSLPSNSSSASLPASEHHENEEETTTSFTVFGPAGEAALSLIHDLPATTYIHSRQEACAIRGSLLGKRSWAGEEVSDKSVPMGTGIYPTSLNFGCICCRYVEQVWEEELRNRKSLLVKADQEWKRHGHVSDDTKEELRKSFTVAVKIHNHRRAKDQRNPLYKLSGSALEKLRLKQLAKEYEKLQSSGSEHPLGHGTLKEFRGKCGKV
jgi:hypothetical protein